MSKEPIYGPASFKNWPPKNNKSAVHPHLTKLSKDYKQTDDLQKAVTAFLSIDDGGYDSIEQAFRCGANFGLYHYIKHSPLPEAQPLEGAKFSHPFRVGRKQNRAVLDANGIEVVVFRKGLQDMAMNYCNMLNAQFATDAGGGKESELREALQQATDFIQQWAQKPNEFELLKRCKSLLTAPSTHSSSEMVESLPALTQQDLHNKIMKKLIAKYQQYIVNLQSWLDVNNYSENTLGNKQAIEVHEAIRVYNEVINDLIKIQ